MAVSRRQLIGDKVSGLCSGVSIVTGRATVFRVVKDAWPGKGRERGYFPLCHIVCTGGGGVFFSLCHIVCTGGGGSFFLFVTLFARAGAGVFSSLSHCFHGIGSGVKAIFKGPAGALVVHHKGSI